MTHNQVLHRAYLASPVWKAKRVEALSFYGCVCNRCGDHGADVHHKTYERVGGRERMDDLEVLCRECHEAHHSVDKVAGKRRKRGIHRRAIYYKLNDKHVSALRERFKFGDLLSALTFGDPDIAREAARMLGCYAYGPGMRQWDVGKPAVRHHPGPKLTTNFTKEFKKFGELDNFLLTAKKIPVNYSIC